MSILVFFQKENKSIRIFFPFLLLRTALELYGRYLGNLGIHNIWVNNIIGALSISFYLFILSVFISNKKIKQITFFASVIFTAAFLISCLLLLPITEMHIYELSIGCLLVIAGCIYFFYELLSYPNDVKLLAFPHFWIATGVLFNFAGEMPVYLFLNFIIKQKAVVLNSVFFMIHFLDIMLNILLIIAFVCRLKLRRPSLSF